MRSDIVRRLTAGLLLAATVTAGCASAPDGGAAAAPAAEKSTAGGSTAQEPAAEEPAVGGSVAQEPDVGGAAVDGPAVGGPAARRPAAAQRWRPAPGITWQWQLSGKLDLSVDADAYSIDGFLNDADVVRELHRRGRKAICYIEVGSAENYRPDYHRWPPEVLGRTNGWPGERWVDIRRPGLLAPILTARMEMCREKGFDAVEPDLMDHHGNNTGFPITAAHQLTFNRWIARLAQDRGMAVALKNDVEQVPDLVDHFDFTINEECAGYDECEGLTPFIKAGKAVLHAEYELELAEFCPLTKRLGLSSIRKNRNLDASRWTC